MQQSARLARTIRPGFFRTTSVTRTFTTSQSALSSWTPSPSPPRLPREEQEIFEKLQSQSTGAFSTPRREEAQQREEPSSQEPGAEASSNNKNMSTGDMLAQLKERARVSADGEGGELHPNVRRGAPPEFEGDVNPKTGEVGGPKNNPLRWGEGSDWSYNGRVTDF